MKKKLIEFLIILIISGGSGVMLPNFFRYNNQIAWPGMAHFTTYSLLSFAFLSMVFFIKTPKKL